MTPEQIDELELIRHDHGGVLQPQHVIEHARDSESLLHGYFEWSDSRAANEYRVFQAREVIRRVRVTILNRDQIEVKVRKYISLATDRVGSGGGYREVRDVIEIDERRQQMIETAYRELKNFVDRYKDLSELGELTESIREFIEASVDQVNRQMPHIT